MRERSQIASPQNDMNEMENHDSTLLLSEEELWRQDDEHEYYKRPTLERTSSLFALGTQSGSSENGTNSIWKAKMAFPWKFKRADNGPRQCHMSSEILTQEVERNVPSQETSESSGCLQQEPLSFSTTMYQQNDSLRDLEKSGLRPRRRQLRRASSSLLWQDYSTSFLRLTVGDGRRHSYHEWNSRIGRMLSPICRVYRTNEFVILIIISILFAKAYPPLGAKYMYPRITSSWIVVVFIFCTFLVLIVAS